MIVKDESENLKISLPNAVKFSNNVIVVDTGSVDDTKKVALEAGAKVYDFKWADDFSAARNYSLSKAGSEWIMRLDADELIREDAFAALRRGLDLTDADVVSLKLNECSLPGFEVKSHWIRESVFRNTKGFHYEKPISEILIYPKNSKKAVFQDVDVYHWGANLVGQAMSEKNKGRLRLYLDYVNGHPNDLSFLYMIVTKYLSLSDSENAMKFIGKILLRETVPGNRDFILAALIKRAGIYFSQKKFNEAIADSERILSIDTSFIEPYCFIAGSLIDRGEYAAAKNVLEKALPVEKKHRAFPETVDYYWDYLRYYYYGMCLFKLGDFTGARTYLEKALPAASDKRPLLKAIEALKKVSL